MADTLIGDTLDALDGVAYWTDAAGVIEGAGARSWAAFTEAAEADLPLSSVVGRNLFDVIAGDDVRGVYRTLHDEVLHQRRHRATFAFRCDAPEIKRDMRMTMGPLRRGDEVVGVLYHSQIISARQRPPMHLLSYHDAPVAVAADSRPIVTMCSFCHDLRWPGASEWVAPEVYYQRGGGSDVRLSHGVCEACFDRLLAEDNDEAARATGG
jgi:hypothetical protein